MTVRVFELHRDRDVTGVSGTGHVATGIIFEDGTGVTHWMTGHISTVVWHTGEHSNPPDTMEAALRDIHQHIDPNTGLPATRIVWRAVMATRAEVDEAYAARLGRPEADLVALAGPGVLTAPGGWCAPVDLPIEHRPWP